MLSDIHTPACPKFLLNSNHTSVHCPSCSLYQPPHCCSITLSLLFCSALQIPRHLRRWGGSIDQENKIHTQHIRNKLNGKYCVSRAQNYNDIRLIKQEVSLRGWALRQLLHSSWSNGSSGCCLLALRDKLQLCATDEHQNANQCNYTTQAQETRRNRCRI